MQEHQAVLSALVAGIWPGPVSKPSADTAAMRNSKSQSCLHTGSSVRAPSELPVVDAGRIAEKVQTSCNFDKQVHTDVASDLT
jgi:hypothetical protein